MIRGMVFGMTFGLGPALPLDSLLAAIVAYLKDTPTVTALLTDPDAIFLDLSNWGDQIKFLVLEGYDERQPGLTPDDEPVDIDISVFGPTVQVVRRIVEAVKNAVDSPNINPNSIRTHQFAFEGGMTKGVMRNRISISREPFLVRNGELAYEGKIQYQFWVTPSQ